jgi:hypothetical protein
VYLIMSLCYKFKKNVKLRQLFNKYIKTIYYNLKQIVWNLILIYISELVYKNKGSLFERFNTNYILRCIYFQWISTIKRKFKTTWIKKVQNVFHLCLGLYFFNFSFHILHANCLQLITIFSRIWNKSLLVWK